MAGKKKVTNHQPFIQSFFYVLGSIILTLVLLQIPFFHEMIAALGKFGYIGALIGGILFVSVFTAAPGLLLLLTLAETHPALPLAIVAGIGGVFGDFIILSMLSNHANETLKSFKNNDGIMKTVRILRHTKYRFFLTVLGAIIIASPLPDELGLSLMGLSKMKRSTFLWLTFSLNAIGVYILLRAVQG